jgi:metal-responsive CopG/Arc/MetJ family transcriptional regulator
MSKVFNISLPEDLVKKADKVAKDNYMSRSDLIRYALAKEVKNQEQEWETIVDFTKINKKGVSATDVLKALQNLK